MQITMDYMCYGFLQHMLHPSIEDKKAEALKNWQDAVRNLDETYDESNWKKCEKNYLKLVIIAEEKFEKIKEIYETELKRLNELHKKVYRTSPNIVSRKEYLKYNIEKCQSILKYCFAGYITPDDQRQKQIWIDKINEYELELKELELKE